MKLVDGLREEYSDLDTCKDPRMSDMPSHYDDVTYSIIVLIKKLKGEAWNEKNKMLGALEALRDWIISHQNMDRKLSGMELEVKKQELKVAQSLSNIFHQIAC